MSKGGRPRKHTKGTGTNQVRVDDDLAQMIGWICEAKGVSTSNLISPLLRDQIEAMYTDLFPMIKKIKEVQDELAKVKGLEPGPDLPDIQIYQEDGGVTSLHEVHLPPDDSPTNLFGEGKPNRKHSPNLSQSSLLDGLPPDEAVPDSEEPQTPKQTKKPKPQK